MFLTKICRDVTATRPRLQHEGASTSVETAEGELLGIAPSAHNSSEIDYYYFGLVAITECAGIFTLLDQTLNFLFLVGPARQRNNTCTD